MASTDHRPWELPAGRWQYYQEWNDALFLHWEVPGELLRKWVPDRLHIDSLDGKFYISVVAFTMQKIRPRNLPPMQFISDFHEINVRTYIDNGDRKGVYFINIEAHKALSVFVSRKLSGLPYGKSSMQRTPTNYVSRNTEKDFFLDVNFEIGEVIAEKTALDSWLTERYCLYLDKGSKLYRYDIHHEEWVLRQARLRSLEVQYRFGEIDLSARPPDLVQYSEGVKVVAWTRKAV